jgi:tetratricopeptide (TPR) repeat protein
LQSKQVLIFKVPYPPNPSFTGRIEILTAIHDHLVANAKPGFTANYALYGLGGVGKTQIAIRYAYMHKASFNIICWLRANDWNTLVSSYVELSRDPELKVIGAPAFEEGLGNAVVAERMKSWFEKETKLKWLLIFDNADKISDQGEDGKLVQLVPRAEAGSVLCTSRDRACDGEIANAGCEVPEMTEHDAVKLLLERSRQHDIEEAKALVRTLGYLPLAIEQAGCYIRTKGIPISRYLSIYQINKSAAFKHQLPVSHEVYYKQTVATTWKISFDEIDSRDPLAGEILRLMAFLDGSNIQKELFEAGGKSLDDDWKLTNATIPNIEDSFGCLLSFSLVRPLTENDVSVHVLVQQVIQEHVRPNGLIFSTAALKLVCSQFPWGGDLQNFSNCLKYLSQAKMCIEKDSEFEVYSDEFVSLANSLAGFYSRDGQYELARITFDLALRITEKAFGVDHVSTADTIMNLGVVYRRQGKYDDAVIQYERALRIGEKAFGVDHVNTADTIMNLGIVYEQQGKYDDAVIQYERALTIKEKAFGVDHINTAGTIHNLGIVYQQQGKYHDAVIQYERALRIKEKAFGVDHLNTADTINNLGEVYRRQGKYDDAIIQFKRALRIDEKAFGVDHVNTADTIMNLSLVFEAQKEFLLAKKHILRGYQIFQSHLGDLHPSTKKAKAILDERFQDNQVRKHGTNKSNWKSRLRNIFRN